MKSLVKAMYVTKKAADNRDIIPSAIDFAKDYSNRFDEVTELPEREEVDTLRKRPSFLFVHPLLYSLFGGVTKVSTTEALYRIIELIAHPDNGV